jgi:hypothetical protein
MTAGSNEAHGTRRPRDRQRRPSAAVRLGAEIVDIADGLGYGYPNDDDAAASSALRAAIHALLAGKSTDAVLAAIVAAWRREAKRGAVRRGQEVTDAEVRARRRDELRRSVVELVSCPLCDASPGQRCVSRGGYLIPVLETHRVRRDAAASVSLTVVDDNDYLPGGGREG